MTASRLVIWLLIMLGVTGLGHFYVWRRLVQDSELPSGWHRSLTIALALLALSAPVTMAFGRTLPRDQITWIALLAFLWLGLLSNLFSFLVLAEPGRFFLVSQRRPKAREPENPGRRRALKRALSAGVAFTSAAAAGTAVFKALGPFRVAELSIALKRLPKEFDGFRIVQISDIHVGPTIGRPFIEELVRKVNEIGGDLVAITGDLVDGSVATLRSHTAPLAELKAAHGAYFVTGNHEYYSGADEWVDELARLGIPTLRNSRVELIRGDARVDLAGVTDHRAGSFGDGPDLARALQGRNPDRELILLAHQPAEVLNARQYGVGLQLSGHTHGGQFWPWTWVIGMIQPVVRGLARFDDTQVYVNTGTGYWGPPMRTGNPPEITVLTLRSGELGHTASGEIKNA